MRSLIVILLLTATISSAGEPVLDFTDAWSPEAPPGRMMAAYATITNHSDASVTLTSSSSPQFERVEIHTVNMDDGVMRMRRLEQLEIAPGQTISLEPGGMHLMLIGPERRLSAGDRIDIELSDASGTRYTLSAEVRAR